MKRLEQKIYYYTFSAENSPSIKVSSGETIVAPVPDFVDGAIKKEGDRLPFALSEPRWNPVIGPVYVEGAEKGDSLKVTIEDIQIDTEHGANFINPLFDDLVYTLLKPSEYDIGICKIESGKISFGNGVTVPLKPNIGCIGTAPAFGAPTTSDAGRFGGNMDVPDVGKGVALYLPVYVDGGLLSLGDCHAWQPVGELSGVEVQAIVTLKIDLQKGKQINWPRIESNDKLMSINTNVPIEKGIQTGISGNDPVVI